MKILLVDDDPSFRRQASRAFQQASIEHHAVATAEEALRALERGSHRSYELLLIDQELPGTKGSELLAGLRRRGVLIPVVLLGAHEAVSERIRALDLGADDYLVKPFAFDELVARMRAVLRRSRTSEALRAGNVELDPLLRRASKGGKPMELTAREFDVLWLLMQAQGRAVSRSEFLHRIWDLGFDPETNSLQVHISRLRRKLGANGAWIETVRGEGYRVAGAAAEARAPGRAHEGIGA